MSSQLSDELELALQAVHRASIVTKNVMKGIESLDKSDASPVTMADFAAQALIISAIHDRYPDDKFIAEESADMLRDNKALLANVWRLVENANTSVDGFPNQLTLPKDQEEMMRAIDLGSKGETPRSGRVWILDPVDGTATFLKGQQYAVCLSLTIDGKQMVGAIGCPNLRPGEKNVREQLTDREGYGVLLGAVLGQGAFITPMSRSGLGTRETVKRATSSFDTRDLQFTDSAKSSHADLPLHEEVFTKLGLKKKSIDLWSMQIKYIALALGACDAMIRIRPDRTMRASVWDHAGGQLIFTEAGGKITDLDGREFDYAKGREFPDNWGFASAGDPDAYDVVFKTVQDVLRANNRI